MKTITIVTAYYEIKSKFPPSQYWKWINSFCSLPIHLCIFTSPNLVVKFTLLRDKYMDKTNIIPLKFEELDHYKYITDYRKNICIDPNKKHSAELYIIWAEKVKFVMKTINLNPFNSEKFIWCDIGIIRRPETRLFFLGKFFPNGDKIQDNKLLLLLLCNFSAADKSCEKYGFPGQDLKGVRIGGGVQAGGIKGWTEHEKLWDQMLIKYFKTKRFAGQDQHILGSLYLENPEFYCLQKNDRWNYLLEYLSTE